MARADSWESLQLLENTESVLFGRKTGKIIYLAIPSHETLGKFRIYRT